MIYIGKGLATLAVWAGCTILGSLGLVIVLGPFVALYAAVVGTVAIWCPEKLKNVLPSV